MMMPSLLRIVLPLFRFRLLFRRLTSPFVMPFLYASCVAASPQILLGKLRRLFFFLLGVGFLSIALTACATFGGGSGGGSPRDFEVDLTFAPISGGFRIASQSDFGNIVSLKITATSGSEVEERNIDIAEFIDDDHEFTGLNDQSDWTFRIIGTLSDGEEREVAIVFVWDENAEDHQSGGIRAGINTDGDGRADSVDEDDDNDGVRDGDEAAGCVLARDCDRDGVMDGEDIDDDGDGLIELATAAELDAVRYALKGDGRRLSEGADIDTTGCGGAGGITSCSGYELVANISLAGYTNWKPLGHDTHSFKDGCQGAAFDGTFEGNGWTISDLSIRSSGRDCVGLFGHIAEDSEIRNLRLHAERVIGRQFVGGLVGNGVGARIVSSSIMVNEVRGRHDMVGGLVGNGKGAQINSSSVVVGEVSGGDYVGGLVGDGGGAQIDSSSVVVGEVSGSSDVGGLVGWGGSAWIHFSSVVAAEVRGNDWVGGLVGDGDSARIVSSSVVAAEVSGGGRRVGGLVGESSNVRIHLSSVVAAEVSGGDDVGGLVGYGYRTWIHSSSVVVSKVSGTGDNIGGLVGGFFGNYNRITYSYVVSGSNTAMLVGSGDGTRVASYWDSDTSGINSGNHGDPKTSDELRSPTDYTGIYADWDEVIVTALYIILGGWETRSHFVWCDKDHSRIIELDEQTNDNLIWDFGESDEYPAIRCTPTAPTEWRSWWFLDRDGKPQLDRTRLDELLPSSN